MKTIYAREPFTDSFSKALFLAGPTPRSKDVESWRPEALDWLRKLNYDGVVFIPEDREGAPEFDYMHQVDWEEEGLRLADTIVFWIPRDIETLPGFTTNIEWGVWQNSGKVVLGSPKQTPKMNYLMHYAGKHQIPQSETLEETLKSALTLIGDGEKRFDGEREVPLFIWRQPAFQQWYCAQRDAGNSLHGISYEWHTRTRPNGTVFCHVLRPKVYIASEDRYKTSEIIISRPDISSVLAYRLGKTLGETKVVLVREFRSNAATTDGFVHELPGGSSPDQSVDERDTAADELSEETGVRLPGDRFVSQGSRQCMATMVTHRGHLYSVELTANELATFQCNEGKRFGINDSERTYVEVRTVHSILSSQDVDWTHVGMILSVLSGLFSSKVPT